MHILYISTAKVGEAGEGADAIGKTVKAKKLAFDVDPEMLKGVQNSSLSLPVPWQVRLAAMLTMRGYTEVIMEADPTNSGAVEEQKEMRKDFVEVLDKFKKGGLVASTQEAKGLDDLWEMSPYLLNKLYQFFSR